MRKLGGVILGGLLLGTSHLWAASNIDDTYYFAWGENCSYGFEEAISIVITLLIDEDIEGVGHRKNILNPGYNSVGVAIRPHKDYQFNCVMDFGQKNRSNLNQVPY